jgi:hypothetical protein
MHRPSSASSNFKTSSSSTARVYGNGVSLSAVTAQIADECEVNPMPPAECPSQCSAPLPHFNDKMFAWVEARPR